MWETHYCHTKNVDVLLPSIHPSFPIHLLDGLVFV